MLLLLEFCFCHHIRLVLCPPPPPGGGSRQITVSQLTSKESHGADVVLPCDGPTRGRVGRTSIVILIPGHAFAFDLYYRLPLVVKPSR